MKTKKNFLKKLAAAALGFVMTLGVGAAGYAASASEVNASSQTFSSTSTSATNVDDGDITSTVNLSSPLKVMSYQNGAGTKFYVKKDDFRMYATKNSYVGNYFTISVNSGYKINSITFSTGAALTTAEVFAGAVTVNSTTKQVTGTKVTGNNGAYTINSTECTVYNNNKSVSSNTQVKFKTIVIDYSTTSSTFNVSYDANKPSGVTADVSNFPSSVTGQTSYTIPTTAPSLNGYTFLGYATTASGDVAYHPGDPVTATTTLYCKWQIIKTPASLTVSGQTTEFYQNDQFVFDGTATVAYDVGGTADVTSQIQVVTSPDMTTIGQGKAVKLSYTENNKTVYANYTVDIVKAPEIETFTNLSTSGSTGTYSKYSFGQGGAGTAPGSYGGGVRLYQGSPGGYMLLEAKTGYDIVGFKIYSTSSYASTTVRYNPTNTKPTGDPTGDSSTAFTLAKDSSEEKAFDAVDYVYIICYGSDKNTRLEVLKVDVYYAAEAAVLNSIAITKQPTKTSFNIGDDFDSSGIIVTGTYSDRSTENVTSDCAFSGYNMSTEGTQTVTVTYKQTSITTTYTITVVDPSEPVLQSITYTGTPVSPQYVGNAFDYTGLTFTGHYDKGDDQPIAGSAINWNALVADQNPSGIKDNVTVTITGVTVKTDVIESITVSGDMTKKSYKDGDEWDFAGLIVTGHYSSGATTDVTSSSTFASDTELINGVTSINVTATYNSIPSEAYQVSGLTVNPIVYYKLVTSTDDLKAGQNYIIGDAASGATVFMATTLNANNRKTTSSFTVSNNGTVDFDDSMLKLELGGSTGAWTFKTVNYDDGKDTSQGYLQSESTGNVLAIGEYTVNYSDFSISFSDSVMTAEAGSGASKFIRKNSSSALFSCYSTEQKPVYLFKEISTAPSFAISPSQVTAHLYGGAVTAELITGNIASPAFTIESNSDSTIASAAITTSGGKDVVSVSPLAAGDTTITVKETTKNKTATLAVRVDRIPASIEMFDKELETGHNVNKSTLLKVYDAGGTPINLSDCVVEWSINDEKVLQENDGSFTGLKQGDAEVSVSVAVPGGTALTGSCDISVVDDYPHPNTWSVTGTPAKMTYDAGDPFIPTGITVTYKTHFHHGSSDTVKTWSDLTKLLYTTSSEGVGKTYPYSFSSDDISSASTTIYVYYEDEQIGSITGITVNAKEVSLESISFVEGEEDELERGEDLTLTPVYYPSNTTDARTLIWTVEQDSSGISVDENGKITIAKDAVVGNVGVVTATSTVSEDITAEFMVTVLREKQTVHVVDVAPESWDIVSDPSTLVAGDVVLLTGIKDNATYAAGTWSSGNNNVQAYADALTVSGSQITTASIKDEMKYTLEEGTVDGSVAFKDSNGKYLYAAGSSSNYLKAQDSIDANASFTIDSSSNVVATESSNRNRMRYNNGGNSNLFSCYANDGTGTVVTFYKKTGGTVQEDIKVSDDLYEAVMDANELGMTATNWASISSLFSGFMSQTSSDEYKILTKGVAKADGNEVQKFLSDYATLVYAGCQDFLHRFTTYTVTFDSNGGSPVSSITALSGQKISAPTAPKKEGHGFDAWYNGDVVFDFANTPIESDLTLTANWNITSYTVTLVGDHVTSNGDASCAYNAPYSATLSADDGYVLPASISVTCEGEEFNTYTYNSVSGLFTIEHMPAGNIAITATAKQGSYSISYAEADGTPIVESQLVNEYRGGVGVTLVNANNKTGYSFAGWYANTSFSGDPITAIGTTEKGNKIFYAKWTYSGQYDLNNVTTSMGMSYKYSADGGEEHVSKASKNTTVTYDFTQISGFDKWGNTYSEHVVEYNEATVTFTAASKQGSTIDDMPVTKGKDVIIVADEGKTMDAINATFKKWNDKNQTITMHYSDDYGETWTASTTTSSDFTYNAATLPEGTNAIKFTFSSTSNQIGIQSFEVKYAPEGPTYTSEFKWSIKNSGLASLVKLYGDAYDDIGIVVSYQGRDRYFSFIQADDDKYYIHEEGKEDVAFSFSKDGSSFAINLGDILQNIDRAEVDFTVTAYIKENGQTHLSENSTTYSVIDWVDEYYGDGETKYSEAVKDIWTILHSLLDE